MEWFSSKKELLEYLGKNPEDRKLIDRMVKRGEVIFDGGMYGVNVEENHPVESVTEDEREQYLEIIKKLETENGKLNNELSQLEQEKGVIEREMDQIKENGLTSSVKGGDDELIQHLEYLYDRNKMKEKVVQKLVNQFYEKNSGSYDKEGATAEVYKRFGYVEDLEEESEMGYIKELINKNKNINKLIK